MFVKTKLYPFTEYCFEEKKIKQFLVCFFLVFRQKLSEILANYLGATLSELPCKCPDESFGKKVLDNFFSSVMMSRKWLDFWHKKKRSALSKLLSTSPQEHFGERIWHVLVFLELERNFFYKFRRKTGQVCRNCIVGGFSTEETFAQYKCFWEG